MKTLAALLLLSITQVVVGQSNGAIAFSIDDNDIYTINKDGSGFKKISDKPGSDSGPAWSPNGDKLAFYTQINSNTASLHIMDADGSNLQRITFDSEVIDNQPSWTPDGRILFAREYPLENDKTEVWIVNSDGSNLQRITNDGSYPHCSNDGTKVVYPVYSDGDGEIWITNIDGSNSTKITDNEFAEWLPAWSPISDQIIFQSDRHGNHEIYMMNADGSNIQRLTNNSYYDGYPRWSPDGSKIVFESTRDGLYQIYTMDKNGRNQKRLTFTNGNTFQPDWQPVFMTGLTGPYLGQEPPGDTPQLFANGIITTNRDWAITFSPDGLECFYTRSLDRMTIMTTKVENGFWIEPEIATFSGQYNDMEPHMSPSGEILYFGSKRPLPNTGSSDLHQWYVEKTNNGWSNPISMDYPLKDIFMMYPSVADNGNIYFTASDGLDQWISVSRLNSDGYQEPERLSDNINSLNHASHPFIAPDESYLLFDVVTRTESNQDFCDLFVSFRNPDGTWTRSYKFGNTINSDQHECCPFVTRDNNYLFLNKGLDIYWVNAAIIDSLRSIIMAKNEIGSNPKKNMLNQNYPNPFSVSTTFSYHLSKSQNVIIKVISLIGQEIVTLINEEKPSGEHVITWNRTDQSGKLVEPGVYLAMILTDGGISSMLMVVAK